MPNDFSSLNCLFKETLYKFGTKTAIVFENKRTSYKELIEGANKVAHALNRNNIKPNTRVALMMSNSLEYIFSDLGVIQAGATKVPLNEMLSEKELEYILNDSKAEVIIVGESFFKKLEAIKENLRYVNLIIAVPQNQDCPNGCLSWDEFQSAEPVTSLNIDVKGSDMAVIVYTGGTTGMPKGVVHDHHNIIKNLYTHIIELEILGDDKILLTSPLPHAAGFVMLTGLLKGAEVWIESGFNPQLVLDRIHNDRITFTFMVPTMVYRVMDQIKGNQYDFTSLRTILYGAAPITVERLKEGLKIFGLVFTQLYGQTEAPNFVTRLRKEDHSINPRYQHRLQSCGQAVLGSLFKVVDESGIEVPCGVEGEIVAHTPYNMKEYFGKPEATNETVKDGWIYTGDIGKVDEEGYLYLLDRKKDMIISGGMNVYSVEVESLIQTHPGVQLNSVIGVPHPDWGESVLAVIVASKENPPTEESIIKHCQQLSKYKRPKEIKFVDNIPLTPYGKIDKKALKKQFRTLENQSVH